MVALVLEWKPLRCELGRLSSAVNIQEVFAWAEDADWYRNLQKCPASEIRTGRERYEPLQRFLSAEEADAALVSYERRHPWAARILGRLLGFPLGGPEAARRASAESARLVAFRPT
jgi:hypothetical protein